MRGHSEKIKSQCLKDIKKYNFPLTTVDIWNELKEEVTATNTHIFKEILEIWRQDTMRLAQTLYNTTR